MLLSCPPALPSRAKDRAKQLGLLRGNCDGYMALMLIILEVTRNQHERAQSIMGLIGSDWALYTAQIDIKDTLKYYRVFKVQVDIINMYGHNPG